jgi:hypothetical protein
MVSMAAQAGIVVVTAADKTIEDLLLDRLNLTVGSLFEIFDVIRVEGSHRRRNGGRSFATAMEYSSSRSRLSSRSRRRRRDQ